MPVVGYADVRVKPSFKDTQSTIAKEFDPAAGKAGASAGKTMGSRMRGALSKTVKVGAVAAGVAVGAALVGGFKSAMNQQNSEKIMGGLYGSAKEAQAMMVSLKKVAQNSPVKYETYLKAAETLAYAGVKGDEATESLENVGKAITAAGGTDEDMNRATDAVLKMVNAGKVSLDSLQQLSGSGVPIISGLAKHFGKSTEEINKMASDGKIGLEDVMSVMQKGTGDTFQSMIKAGEEASQSFGNQWKIAKDNVTSAIGTTMLPMLDKLGPLLNIVGSAVAASIGKIPGAFAAAGKWATSFMGGVQDVASAVSDFLRPAIEKLGIDKLVTALGEKLPGAASAVGDAFRDASKWVSENGEVFGRVAGIIGVVMIPAFVRLGIAALVSSVKQAAAWVTAGAGAAKTAAMYVINSYKIIGTWVAMGLAAIKSGAETVAIWLMYRVESAKAAAAMLLSKARIVGAWVAMGAAAVVSGLKTAAVWTGTIIKQAAVGAFAFGVSAAKVVGGWVLMGVQSLLQAARMAAAWFIALGPVGWVIAAVIGLAAIVIANWNKISKFTKKIWGYISDFVKRMWQKLVVDVVINLLKFWTKVKFYFNLIKNFAVALWKSVRDRVVSFIVGLVVKAINKFISMRNKIVYWFNLIKTFAVAVWQSIKDRVVEFVVGLVVATIRKFSEFKQKVSDIFTSVKNFFSNIWKKGIKPIFDTLGNFVTKHVVPLFKKGVDKVKSIWESIKKVAKKPITFLVKTVLNKGLIPAFNKVAGWIPGVKDLDPVSIPGFRKGGWTGPGASKDWAGDVHADEFVVQKKSRRTFERDNPGFLDHVNRFGRAPGYKKGGLVNPMPGAYRRISAGLNGYPGHAGTDYPAPVGTVVRSPGKGIVSRVGFNLPGGTGLQVWINHVNGLMSRVHHLSKALVSKGQNVNQGTPVGKVGMTGNTTGPHAHWGVMNGSKYLNPASVWGSGRGGDGGFYSGGKGGGGGLNIGSILSGITGLKDKLGAKFRKEFPGGGHMLDMAKGMGKKAITDMMDWAKGKLANIGDAGNNLLSRGKNFLGFGNSKDQVRGVAGGYNWAKGDQWKALSNIIGKESGWDKNAANPSSSARGLFQKMTSIHGAIEKTAGDQAGWGLNYIKGRYGDPIRAWAHWQRNKSYSEGGHVNPLLYDKGGYANPGLTQVMNKSGKPEPVLSAKQWSDISTLAGTGGAGGDTYQFNVPDRATAQDYFDEARFQSRRKARGGVSV